MSHYHNQLYLAVRFLAANALAIADLDTLLPSLVAVIYELTLTPNKGDPCLDLLQMLEIFLVDIPELVELENVLELANHLLQEVQTAHKHQIEEPIVPEIGSLWPENSIPEDLENVLSLSEDEVAEIARESLEEVRQQAQRFQWPNDYSIDLDSEKSLQYLYKSFVQARLLMANHVSGEFPNLERVKKSSFHSSELEKWLRGSYSPLATLSTLTQVPSLLDWEQFMTPTEKIELVVALAIETGAYELLVGDVLATHLSFVDGFVSFNRWLVEFEEKTTDLAATTEFTEAQFDILANIIRQDSLLVAMRNTPESLQAFASIVIAVIYLCPKVSLKIYLEMKEFLVCLESVGLAEGSGDDVDFEAWHPTVVSELYPIIEPTVSLIKTIRKYVETGERLYSNGLPLYEIVRLSNADLSRQSSELQRYINNEMAFGKSSQKWESLLSSIYWMFKNTHAFSKVTAGQLDRLVLDELLDLRYFNLLSNVFLQKYCNLDEEELKVVFLNHAWKFYKRATNCDMSIGFLKSTMQCLDLIRNQTDDEVVRLRELVLANNQLLNWKLYFTPGVPVTPKIVLDVGDPFAIISKIFELNEGSYSQVTDLVDVLGHLVVGLDRKDVDTSVLDVRVKLICLDFATAQDFEFSYKLAIELLERAVEAKRQELELFLLIQDKWFSFFQLVKNEFGESNEDLGILERKLNVLSKLMLVVPTEFNVNVLEQWQLLSTVKDQLESQLRSKESSTEPTFEVNSQKNREDLQSRFQRSLQSSANEILRGGEGGELGKNIIGWIVGAQ